MEGKITRIGKRIMTLMLSLIVVTGVFTGMKLDVKAADTYSFDVTVTEQMENAKTIRYKAGDTLTFTNIANPDNKYFDCNIRCYVYYNGSFAYFGSMTSQVTEKDAVISWTISFPFSYWGYSDLEFEIKDTLLPNPSNEGESWRQFNIYFDVFASNIEIPVSSKDDFCSEPAVAPSHECNFQWGTTLDPTTGADGLEEYKCAGCGLVKESHPIPASVAAVKDFYGNIKEAPQNGSITYDTGKLYTISDYLLKKMSERGDVTVTVNFEYQRARYEITFPAGTDYTPVLKDEDMMYGYFGVASKLGLSVVAK